MDEPIPCPQCGAPARITERFRLGSTAGPVEHLKTGCVNNHWLTPLAEMVRGQAAGRTRRSPGSPCPPDSSAAALLAVARCLAWTARLATALYLQPQALNRQPPGGLRKLLEGNPWLPAESSRLGSFLG